jgi:predicted transcriptional regulator
MYKRIIGFLLEDKSNLFREKEQLNQVLHTMEKREIKKIKTNCDNKKVDCYEMARKGKDIIELTVKINEIIDCLNEVKDTIACLNKDQTSS